MKSNFLICVNSRFRRIKVESHQFVALEQGTDWSTTGTINFLAELDERQAMRLIRYGKLDLFISYFPQANFLSLSDICSGNLLLLHANVLILKKPRKFKTHSPS